MRDLVELKASFKYTFYVGMFLSLPQIQQSAVANRNSLFNTRHQERNHETTNADTQDATPFTILMLKCNLNTTTLRRSPPTDVFDSSEDPVPCARDIIRRVSPSYWQQLSANNVPFRNSRGRPPGSHAQTLHPWRHRADAGMTHRRGGRRYAMEAPPCL